MINEAELRSWGITESLDRQNDWASLLLEIDSRISLTSSQYEGLKSRYESIGKILENPDDKLLGDILFFPQGSFRTQTITRPYDREDVDIDAVAYVIGGTTLPPIDLLDRFCVELKNRARTGGNVKSKKRCVTIQYIDESLPCHMDVTPAEAQPNNYKDDGTGRLRVPDRPSGYWSPSNPKDYASWFEDIAETELSVSIPDGYRVFLEKRAEAEPLPSHEEIKAPNALRVTVRLMKRHRDIYVDKANQKATKPISVIITTLAAKAYQNVVSLYHGQTVSPFTLISEVVAEMPNCFDVPTTKEHYRLLNPRDSNENFAEKWNDNVLLVRTFKAWHQNLMETLRYGYINFPSRNRFREALINVFGVSAGPACDDFYAQQATIKTPSKGLLQTAAVVPGLTFPNKPVRPPNKPKGFA